MADDLPFRFVPPVDPNLGRLVDGHRIDSLIGRGGMGAAYLAIHEGFKSSKCVIKLVLKEIARHPQALARFQQEARALSVLNKHDHIVRLENVGVLDDGQLYLRFEYIEGKSLDRYVAAQGGRLPLRKAVEFAFQVCSAMSYAHDKQIIHRDLKPDNLMVEFNPPGSPLKERIKVLDFGIAKVTANAVDGTGSGMALGTARFMAPEQVTDAASVTEKADVFSLGQTLCWSLSGKMPWGLPESDIAIYHRQRTEAPTMPPEALVPPEVARVILRCLSLNPDDRPTMRELAVELACAIPAGRGLESGTEILKRIVPDWVKSSPHNGRTLPRLLATDPSVTAGPPSIGGAASAGAFDDAAAVPAALVEVASGGELVPAEMIAAAPSTAPPAPVGNLLSSAQPATANARPRALAASLASSGSAVLSPAAGVSPTPSRSADSPAAELEGDSTERQAWTPPPPPILAALPTGLLSQQFNVPVPPPEDRAPSLVVAAEIQLAGGTPVGPQPYAHAELPPVVVSMTQLSRPSPRSGPSDTADSGDARAPVREPAPFIMLPDAQPTKLSTATVRRKVALVGVAVCAVVVVVVVAVVSATRFSSRLAGDDPIESSGVASYAPVADDAAELTAADGSAKRSAPAFSGNTSRETNDKLALRVDATVEGRADADIGLGARSEQPPSPPHNANQDPSVPLADDAASASSGSGSRTIPHPTNTTAVHDSPPQSVTAEMRSAPSGQIAVSPQVAPPTTRVTAPAPVQPVLTSPSNVKANGQLVISVTPWAAIWINGRSVPDGTPYREQLPPGRYRVRIANDDLSKIENLIVTIEPNKTTTIERKW